MCPHWLGSQVCGCVRYGAGPASQADSDDIPAVVDMRDPDRKLYPHLYVDPLEGRSDAE